MSLSLSALRRALQSRSPQELRPWWRDLQDPFDLLVIGGGVHGAGIARDAALRGLRVAVVEQRDWASGTSSRSSKLFHGGLRYLAYGQFSLVRKSLQERNLHVEYMPHLVRPLRFQVALPGRPLWMRLKFRIGVGLYDVLTLGASKAKVWGDPLSYNDAVTDDARFVWELVRDARDHGALAINYCRWTGWIHDHRGRITGATLCDQLTHQVVRVRARACVNATGPWGRGLEPGGELRLTRGTHVVLRGQPEDGEARLFLSPQDDRVMFVIPYLEGCSLVGTTDVDTADLAMDPIPSADEIQYIGHSFGEVFPHWRSWKPVGWQCGQRPLVRQEGHPSQVPREEDILRHPDTGLWSVFGGKLTGYRAVAEQVVDAITGSKAPTGSRTQATPLKRAASGEDPLEQAFEEEDAVLLEDVFLRRTFWGYSGEATPDRVRRAREHLARRWDLAPPQAAEVADAFLDYLRSRQRVLDLWP